MHCFDKIYSNAGARAHIRNFENLEPGNSKFSMSVMQAICDRVGKKDCMADVLELMYHHYRHGHLDATNFVVATMRSQKNSPAEWVMLQLEFRAWLMDEVRNMNLPHNEATGIREFGLSATKWRKIRPFPCWSSVRPDYQPPPQESPDHGECTIERRPRPRSICTIPWDLV